MPPSIDVIEAIHTRRSIRAYQAKPVDPDLIEQIILDAAQAPPPTAAQPPLTFNVILGADRIAAYGETAMSHARDNHPPGPGWSWLDRPGFKVFWNAPAVIIISGPPDDCIRAGQNLMLSSHARGLGTCWVGAPMLWLRTPAAKTELAIPAALKPAVAMCLGYAQIIPEPPARGVPVIIWRS